MTSLTINNLTKIINEPYKLIKTQLIKTHPLLLLRIDKIPSVTPLNHLVSLASRHHRRLKIKDLKGVNFPSRRIKKCSTIPNNNKTGVQCYSHHLIIQQATKLQCNNKLHRNNKLKNKSRD